MKLTSDTFTTPCGPFSAALTEDGAVIATAFGRVDALKARLPAGAELTVSRLSPALRTAVAAYFENGIDKFNLRLRLIGSPFQQKVWAALRQIPAGETRTYGDIARQIGSAPRAVGRANATNPICLFIPCHRVIGANATLTGYAFGEAIKQQLLEHEGALRPARP